MLNRPRTAAAAEPDWGWLLLPRSQWEAPGAGRTVHILACDLDPFLRALAATGLGGTLSVASTSVHRQHGHPDFSNTDADRYLRQARDAIRAWLWRTGGAWYPDAYLVAPVAVGKQRPGGHVAIPVWGDGDDDPAAWVTDDLAGPAGRLPARPRQPAPVPAADPQALAAIAAARARMPCILVSTHCSPDDQVTRRRAEAARDLAPVLDLMDETGLLEAGWKAGPGSLNVGTRRAGYGCPVPPTGAEAGRIRTGIRLILDRAGARAALLPDAVIACGQVAAQLHDPGNPGRLGPNVT